MGLYCELNIARDWGFPLETAWGSGSIYYAEAIAAYTQMIYNEMINNVPVDTGYLRSSLKWSSNNEGFVIETDCDYAEYVEYGTCYMDAQPYFEQAIDKYAENLFNELQQIYLRYQSDALRNELEKESRKADGASFGGGGFGLVEEKSSGPKMKIVWPDTGPFEVQPGGKMTARSWQASNPSMWRPGTRQYEYAVKMQAERSKYFDANNMAKPEYRPRVEFVNEPSSSGSSSGGNSSLLAALGMMSTGDEAFDISWKVGAYAGLSLMSISTNIGQVVSAALVGIVLTVALYFVLRTLIDAVSGNDPGEKISYQAIEVQII